MKILEATEQNISIAAEVIKTGGLAAFPTETVYGLGADGLNPIAVAKIFEAKNRPAFNPLILHVANYNQLEKICLLNNKKIELLITEFWPGPLTLVLPKKNIVPDIVTSGNNTVAVRMPDHPVALSLITKTDRPIAAPSANKFGELSPTTSKHVQKQLGKEVDIILDGGACRVGVESTILEITENEIIILRPGGLPVEEIEEVAGKVSLKKNNLSKPNSPGQLPFHYSPKIPLKILSEKVLEELNGKKVGALLFSRNNYDFEFDVVKILSEKKDLHEAAANLFSYLHELENSGVDFIVAERVEETGLGKAIMDRLIRASNKY